jgi:hypothetical protein
VPPIVEIDREEHSVMAMERPLDCPECSSAGSVTREFCEVCYAEVGEYCGRPALHPAIRFRFTDVVEELRAIAELASQAVEVEGSRLAMACRRAESLLRVLRLQFMEDVVFGVGQPGTGA